MVTPYDWQEAIGHRAQYIESRLAVGTPVVAASIDEGILLLTYRREARKLFEIYDRLAMGSIGQQSDVEAVRVAAIEFAHREGYARSEQDVTLQRAVTAISGPMKKAFADFNSAPVVAMALFAEVGVRPEEDHYAVLEYDGDYNHFRRAAVLAATNEQRERLQKLMAGFGPEDMPVEQAMLVLEGIWRDGYDPDGAADGEDLIHGLTKESALLMRRPRGTSAFRMLTEVDR